MGLGDIGSPSVLQGAGSGALTGGMIGGPPGAVVGGLIGGGLGYFAGKKKNQGMKSAQSALDNAMASLNASKIQDYTQRMNDLKSVQSFYGPAVSEWNRLYGRGNSPTPQSNVGLGAVTPSGRF